MLADVVVVFVSMLAGWAVGLGLTYVVERVFGGDYGE